MTDTISCPDCGRPMVLKQSFKFTYVDGSPHKFYGCSGWPECKGAHGAHQNGRPMGTPANYDTKQARIRAHLAFDRLWQEGKMSRRAAYRELQKMMGMDKSSAHIGCFNIAQCERLIKMLSEHNVPTTGK